MSTTASTIKIQEILSGIDVSSIADLSKVLNSIVTSEIDFKNFVSTLENQVSEEQNIALKISKLSELLAQFPDSTSLDTYKTEFDSLASQSAVFEALKVKISENNNNATSLNGNYLSLKTNLTDLASSVKNVRDLISMFQNTMIASHRNNVAGSPIVIVGDSTFLPITVVVNAASLGQISRPLEFVTNLREETLFFTSSAGSFIDGYIIDDNVMLSLDHQSFYIIDTVTSDYKIGFFKHNTIDNSIDSSSLSYEIVTDQSTPVPPSNTFVGSGHIQITLSPGSCFRIAPLFDPVASGVKLDISNTIVIQKVDPRDTSTIYDPYGPIIQSTP